MGIHLAKGLKIEVKDEKTSTGDKIHLSYKDKMEKEQKKTKFKFVF